MNGFVLFLVFVFLLTCMVLYSTVRNSDKKNPEREALILTLLVEHGRPVAGSEIATMLEQRGLGPYASAYPLLRKMEEERLISSKRVARTDLSNGYYYFYGITPIGMERLLPPVPSP